MAISYVGGVQGGRAGSNSTTTQSLSGTLTGGTNSSPSTGDLVVVMCAAGADITAISSQAVTGNNSGAYVNLTEQSQLGSTYDSEHIVGYQIQGVTVDTSITIPSTGGSRNAQRWVVHVFRGVDSTTPMDVTATYATGTGTGRPNPAAIEPVTAGAWICAFYASAAGTGAAYTAPTDFATNWLGGTTADTADCMTGGGYYTGWTSGSYDPAAITAGGTTNAADAWTATTIALRPALPSFTQAAYGFYEDGTETGSTLIASTSTSTYYFDGSDAAASDPDSVWTNDANAFDGSTTTHASCSTAGSTSSNFLLAEGTNAPSTGDPIIQVRARIYNNAVLPSVVGNATVYTDSLGESLGNATIPTNSPVGWQSYTTLSTPSGGWTWAKIQALEVKLFATDVVSGNYSPARIEIEVTTDGSITRDVSGGDSNLQLRVRLQETNGTAGDSTDDYQLQYELNDGGNIDEYDFANASLQVTAHSTVNSKIGQSITGDGRTIRQVDLYLHKSGSPTGNAVVVVYEHSGTFGTSSVATGSALATSDNLDVSTLGTSTALTSFVFSGANQIELASGTNYIISLEYSGGSTFNYIVTQVDFSSPTHPGNYSTYNSSSWTANSGRDLIFYVLSGWTNVSSTSTVVLGFNSGSLTDGNATTNRLGSGTGSFVAGEISEDGLVDDLQITASNYTELLYSLTIDSDAVADNDTLDFRVLRNGAVLNTYTVTPRITIQKTAGDDHTLVTQDSSWTFVADATTITQNHVLSPNDSSFIFVADNGTITQNHILSPNDSSWIFVADTTTVDVTVTIAPNDSFWGFVADSTTISQNHVLTPNDASFNFVADAAQFTQDHVIQTADSFWSFAADATTITQNHLLTPADSSFSFVADATTISQNHVLTSQDSRWTFIADSTTINQNHVITPQDSQFTFIADSTVVEENSSTITPADSFWIFQADATTINQNHILAPSDSLFNFIADSSTISQIHNLTPVDSFWGFVADAAQFSQDHVLQTADSFWSFIADTNTITQNHVIATNDAQFTFIADGTTIDVSAQIFPNDASWSFVADATTIAQNHVLTTQEGFWGFIADSNAITQNHIIVPQDSSWTFVADSTEVSATFVISPQNASFGGSLSNIYIDSDGNVYYILSHEAGLLEPV